MNQTVVAQQVRSVVTAAFEDKVPFPVTEEGSQFLTQNMDEQYWGFYRILFDMGLLHLRGIMRDELNAAGAGHLLSAKPGQLDLAYDKFDELVGDQKEVARQFYGVVIGKKRSRIKIPLAVYRGEDVRNTIMPPIAYGEPYVQQTTMPDGSTRDYKIYSYNAWLLAVSRLLRGGSSAQYAVEHKPEYDPIVFEDENMSDPLKEWFDKETYSSLLQCIKGYEFIFTAMDTVTDRGSYDYLTSLDPSKTSVVVRAVVEVPNEVVEYLTQSKPANPISAYRWLTNYHDYMCDDGSYPGPMRDLRNIVEDISGLRPIRKTNELGLLVNYDGEILYVPETPDLSAYEKYEAAFKPFIQEGKTTIKFDYAAAFMEHADKKGKGVAIKLPKNSLLYTDWRMDKVSYITTTGNLSVMDFTGAKPLPTAAFAGMIDVRMDTDNTVQATLNLLTDLMRYYKISWNDMLKAEDFVFLVPTPERKRLLSLSEADGVLRFLAGQPSLRYVIPTSTDDMSLWALIRATSVGINNITSLGEDRYTAMYGDEFDYEAEPVGDKVTVQSLWTRPMLRCISRIAQKVHEHVKGDYTPLFNDFGVSRIMRCAPYLILLATVKDYRELRAKDVQERQIYTNAPLDENYTPLPVPNIQDEFAFLPHQVKADDHFKNDAPNAVGAIAPGGGKTMLATVKALRKLAKGKRVLGIMPNYLLSNYIEDALYATQGKLNIFCITNTVYAQYGEEKLRQMILNAPPNTLFLAGLSAMSRGQNVDYSYNGMYLSVNQIVEFLRDIDWDEVFIDESHKIANPESKRTLNVARVAGSATHITEWTGTYINSTMVDAFGQQKLMDPSLFGTYKSFTAKFGETFAGEKVILWKPRSEQYIRGMLKSRVDFVNIRRKEWVALLPNREEEFHWVTLSEAQRKVYDAIMDEVVAEIMKDKKLMEKLNSASEDEAEGLEQYLRRYLARVEKYLASCDLDEIGRRVLQGDDLISPKTKKINEILRAHFKDPKLKNGKVLIFTSFRDSAKSIYDNLDEDVKKMALHYTAENKSKLIPRMKRDPNVKIVVGVEESLNTGHNFQQYNHIIRVETVWNPGTLDQAESRIFRPNVKEKETRSSIKFDWICTDRTIDVTKTARLISKIISSVKFNEVDDIRYQGLPDLAIVSMTFENIKASNSFEADLMPYLDGYKEYKQIEEADYEEYRKKTKHREPVLVPNAGVMKGSALMRVPYIPDMKLPGQDELGLQNLSDVALDLGIDIDDLKDHIIGKRVHTEYGDGEVTSASRSAVRVRLDAGGTVSSDKTATFLLTKPIKGDTWTAIQKFVGLKPAKDVTEVTEEVVDTKVVEDNKPRPQRPRKPVPAVDLDADGQYEVFLSNINDMVCVSIDGEDADIDPQVMKRAGLTFSGPYYYAYIPNYRRFRNIIDKLSETFEIPNACLNKLNELEETFSEGRRKLFNVEMTHQMDIRNFYRLRRKTVPNGVLYVYPSVEDGDLYLVVYADKQPSARKLPRIRVPGVTWEKSNGFYGAFFQKKTEAKKFIKDLPAKGIKISNMPEVKDMYNELRIVKKR